jgi:predicted metal-dependent phosphoesterase TrpH
MARLAIGPRALAAALAAGAVILSATAAAPPPRSPAVKGGFVVLAGDFHVHSFPGDGAMPPWELAREARRRRLDVIGLTNHNSMLSWRLAQRLSPLTGTSGAMLVPGEELTAVGYHIAAIGLDRTVAWRQPAAAAAAAIHARGGIAIAAHPGRRDQRRFDDAALDALDGVEVAHPAMHAWDEDRRDFAAFYERAVRRHPHIAAIGSTDFHFSAPLGLCRTYLLAKSATQAGVLDAIRAGSTVACDGRGNAYGPAPLVELVRDDCRRDAAAPPEGQAWLDAVATWAVWLGLFALVVFGADERGLR